MENTTPGDNLASATNNSVNNSTDEKKRVLLAEDDPAMRRLLEVVLQRGGYEVVSAEDGLQALQAAGNGQFDVAVIDAIMPNLSGIELCRILRSNPDWQKMLLIMMSGLEAESDCAADAHLLKSSRLQEELLEKISNLLASRK